MSKDLAGFDRNIFDTDDTQEREGILRARLEVFRIVLGTVREELGLPVLTENSLTARSQVMLVKSAIRDSYTTQVSA